TPIVATAIAIGIAERGSMSIDDCSEGPTSSTCTSVSYEPMADGTRTVRVRLSVRSALAIVFALVVTALLLEIAQNAERVIAWVLIAAAIAALVFPAVEWMTRSRFVPRGLAVLILVIVALGTIGFLGYRIVNDVSDATTQLQDAAPARAAQLERDSDFWRE